MVRERVISGAESTFDYDRMLNIESAGVGINSYRSSRLVAGQNYKEQCGEEIKLVPQFPNRFVE